jgi:hypothetical protein
MIITVLTEYYEEENIFPEEMPFEQQMELFHPKCAFAFDDIWKRTCIFDAVLQWNFPSISMEVIEKYGTDNEKCAALCYGLWIRVGFDDGFFYRRLSKKETGLAVDLYLDDSGFWRRKDCWGRPVIKFQSSVNKHHHFITLSLNYNPQILTRYPQYKLTEGEISEIKQYVRQNRKRLLRCEW